MEKGMLLLESFAKEVGLKDFFLTWEEFIFGNCL